MKIQVQICGDRIPLKPFSQLQAKIADNLLSNGFTLIGIGHGPNEILLTFKDALSPNAFKKAAAIIEDITMNFEFS